MEAIRLAPKYPGGPFSGRAFLVFPTVAAAEVRASLKPERHNPRGGGCDLWKPTRLYSNGGLFGLTLTAPLPRCPIQKADANPATRQNGPLPPFRRGLPPAHSLFSGPGPRLPNVIQRTFRFGIKFLHSWLIRGIFVFLILWDSVGFLIQAREV